MLVARRPLSRQPLSRLTPTASSVRHSQSASFASSLAALLASLDSSAAIAATGCAASFALIGLTSRCFAHRARASCAPRHCHPYQFPLKSYGFSGAETARKRFLLWKMGFSAAKIAPSPPYTPPGTIKARKGFGSTIRNSRLATLPLASLLCSLDFRFACFRHWRRRSSVPTGLTSRCFAHSARASCAPFGKGEPFGHWASPRRRATA